LGRRHCPAPATGSPDRVPPGGLRLGRKGSLAISADGSWFDHEAGKGGPDTLSLIRHLKNCSAAEAVSWAQTWLDQHPGDGELSADGAAEMEAEAGERRSAYVRRILDEAGDALGTPAETYLRSRGLEPPYPSCVRFLEDARLGESALVGILTTADGEEAGVQLGYLDPAGCKSTIQPIRQLFLIDKEKAKQGAFRIPVSPVEEAPGPRTDDGAACETRIRPGKDIVKSKPGPDGPGGPDGFGLDEKGPPLAHTQGVTRPLVIVEGLEDALSVARFGLAHEVIACPASDASRSSTCRPTPKSRCSATATPLTVERRSNWPKPSIAGFSPVHGCALPPPRRVQMPIPSCRTRVRKSCVASLPRQHPHS
jgi:hypothetical protein